MKLASLLIALCLTAPSYAGDLSSILATLTAPTPDPVLGPSWTYPGDIYNHLKGPNHAKDIQGVDLSKLTRQQAEDLHSDLHNADQLKVRYSYTSLMAASDCPNGVCPVRQPVRSVAVTSRTVVARTAYRTRVAFNRRPRLLGRIFKLFGRRRR